MANWPPESEARVVGMETPPWYESLFSEEYLRLWAPSLTQERTDAEIEGILRLLELPPGARILDLCCGHGRHAVPLAERGFRVTGLDLSKTFLEHARRVSAERNVEVTWLQGDMRHLPFEGEFDAVVNLFTAFGYFEDEEEDLEVLRGVRRTLRPSGKFLLDVMNREALMRRFQPHSITRHEDGQLSLDERSLDPLTGRISTRMTVIQPDCNQHEHRFDVRVYSLTELARLLKAAGLELTSYYGGLDGSPWSLERPRLAVLATRPVD
jgi:SAM-dependent methyltransferase